MIPSVARPRIVAAILAAWAFVALAGAAHVHGPPSRHGHAHERTHAADLRRAPGCECEPRDGRDGERRRGHGHGHGHDDGDDCETCRVLAAPRVAETDVAAPVPAARAVAERRDPPDAAPRPTPPTPFDARGPPRRR
ncbi:MAG TPA: hypothetical protein VEI02_01090 [Planctomycetota bacterium]|nr:hypothetical protein [Planctomycetota bacterium]